MDFTLRLDLDSSEKGQPLFICLGLSEYRAIEIEQLINREFRDQYERFGMNSNGLALMNISPYLKTKEEFCFFCYFMGLLQLRVIGPGGDYEDQDVVGSKLKSEVMSNFNPQNN